jgi:hypothetical protein
MKNLVRANDTGNEPRAIRIATVFAPSDAMAGLSEDVWSIKQQCAEGRVISGFEPAHRR